MTSRFADQGHRADVSSAGRLLGSATDSLVRADLGTFAKRRLGRRQLVGATLGATAALGGLRRHARAQVTELRIGYQKGSAVLLVLKAEGELERHLNDQGYTVTWTEF